MALTFGFYDSVNGDRTYNAKDFSRFFDGILTDGIFGDIGDALRVTAGSGLSVNVGIGRAWFNRTWTWNDSVLNISLPTADPVLPRIDTVALIIDDTLRTNSIEIIQGTASSSPVAPTLTNTSDHHEYRLANVAVSATATSITNNDITDFVGTSQTPYTNVMGSMLFFQNATMPVMDGQASIGVKKEYARSDHRHPTDTSRAPIQSPEFTGTPKAPTAADGTSTTQLATTAFVQNRISALLSSNSTFSGNPNFSGNATAKTQVSSDNSTKIATTAFVKSVINGLASSDSPVLTGTPTAPTASVGTNNTQIATTAFAYASQRAYMFTAKCSTANGTVAKTATLTGSNLGLIRSVSSGGTSYYAPQAQTPVAVTFIYGNSVDSPTLALQSGNITTRAYPIRSNPSDISQKNSKNYVRWGSYTTVLLVFDGEEWNLSASDISGVQAYETLVTTRAKNRIFAGPYSGNDAVPSFRALGLDDLPRIPFSKIDTTGQSVNQVVMVGGTGTSTPVTRAVRNNTNTSSAITADDALITSNTLKNALNRASSVAAADTAYTTPMARGIALYASTATPSLTVNGTIAFTYE